MCGQCVYAQMTAAPRPTAHPTDVCSATRDTETRYARHHSLVRSNSHALPSRGTWQALLHRDLPCILLLVRHLYDHIIRSCSELIDCFTICDPEPQFTRCMVKSQENSVHNSSSTMDAALSSQGHLDLPLKLDTPAPRTLRAEICRCGSCSQG